MKVQNFEVYISVHDQDIILELERNNIFRYLDSYKYLFLGMRPVDKLNDYMDKLIIVRDLPNNIEDQKCLYDYTGQYALAKNDGLVKASHVIIIQYDCFVCKDFMKSIKRAFKHNPDCFVNFQPQPLKSDIFLKDLFARATKKACKEVYDLDLEQKCQEFIERGDLYWPAGGTFACSFENFKKFIDWMNPLLPYFVLDSMSAHNIERSVKFFCEANNLEEVYLPEIMEHIFYCSHDQVYKDEELLQASRDRYEKYIKGELFEEYDKITFNRKLHRILNIVNDGNYKIFWFLGHPIKIKRKIKS